MNSKKRWCSLSRR